jgi:hypothetical protein
VVVVVGEMLKLGEHVDTGRNLRHWEEPLTLGGLDAQSDAS